MSTKAAAKAAATAHRARSRFARLLFGTITALAVLAGALTAANLAQEPRVNSTSSAARMSTTPDFDVYSLQRDDRLGSDGAKKPDTIRGANLAGRGSTVLVTAQRIQQYALLPDALAVVTLNDDDTGSLEIVPFLGGPPVKVPLPHEGQVENLHATGSGHLIGYTFTSADVSDGRWKSLFVYDPADPSVAPREVVGVDGQALSAWDWTFVPDTTSLVVQTDDQSMFLVDSLGSDTVSPLGRHGEMRGFIPGTQELVVADRTDTSTINLADGTVTPLDLPDSVRSTTSFAGKSVVLDENGRLAQVSSEYAEGRETSLLTVADQNGSNVVFRPAPEWSRLADVCVSPDGRYLAVETTAPEGVSDRYPNLPGFSPMKTEIVDLDTGANVRSVPGFLASWCS